MTLGTRPVGILALAIGLAVSSLAVTAPTTCLPFPLPTTPLPPVFTMALNSLSEHAQLQLWRQPCEDGSGAMAVLIRVTPTTSKFFVCSSDFTLFHGPDTLTALVNNTPGFASQCGDVSAATAFLLSPRFDPKTFRDYLPFAGLTTAARRRSFRCRRPRSFSSIWSATL